MLKDKESNLVFFCKIHLVILDYYINGSHIFMNLDNSHVFNILRETWEKDNSCLKTLVLLNSSENEKNIIIKDRDQNIKSK